MTATELSSPVGAAPSHRAGHYGLRDVALSEWIKVRTVRSTVWTLALTVVISIGIGALATAETRAHWASMGAAGRASFDPTMTSLTGLFFGQLTIGILGVLVMSAEYSSGTIRATLSAAPRRPLVLVAKTAVFGVIALVVSEILAFASFFLGQALLTAPARHATISSPGALRSVVGAGLYLCAIGLLALGLAAIIRHTAGAISAFVGVLLILPLIVAALPSSISNPVRRYLPDRIGASIISRNISGAFNPWVGLLIIGGYAAGLLVIGGVLLHRRDA